MKETKPVHLAIRLTETQARILKRLSRGTTKSEVIRRLLVQAARQENIQVCGPGQKTGEYHG